MEDVNTYIHLEKPILPSGAENIGEIKNGNTLAQSLLQH